MYDFQRLEKRKIIRIISLKIYILFFNQPKDGCLLEEFFF